MPLAVFVSLLGLGLVEMFAYRGVIVNKLGVEYLLICVVGLMAVLAARKLFDFRSVVAKKMLSITRLSSLGAFGVFSVAGVVFFLLDSYVYPNYTFGTLGINAYITPQIAVFGLALHLATAQMQRLKTYWPTYLLLGFLSVCFFLYIEYPLFFISLGQGKPFHGTDDTLFEWSHVVITAVAGALAIWAGILSKTPWARYVCYAAAVVCIFLAGEEMSWGERFIDFSDSSAAVFTENNYQGEVNLHNKHGLNELFAYLYIVAFVYAAASFAARKLLVDKVAQHQQLRELFEFITFKGQEVGYLLPTFIFNPYINHAGLIGGRSILERYDDLGLIADFNGTLVFMGIWREAFEVLFYLVILLRIYSYIQYKRSAQS